jgi:hypothetical protein
VVKGIPYFVNDDFLRSVHRDPYKKSSVEKQVDKAYETYLVNECRQQKRTKRQLEQKALNHRGSRTEKEELTERAKSFLTSRCKEHEDLYVRGSRS